MFLNRNLVAVALVIVAKVVTVVVRLAVPVTVVAVALVQVASSMCCSSFALLWQVLHSNCEVDYLLFSGKASCCLET